MNDYEDGDDDRYDGVGIDFDGLWYPINVLNDYGDGDDERYDGVDIDLCWIKISNQWIEWLWRWMMRDWICF